MLLSSDTRLLQRSRVSEHLRIGSSVLRIIYFKIDIAAQLFLVHYTQIAARNIYLFPVMFHNPVFCKLLFWVRV
jgi:hypothetical protein